jgi:hypothetical protein
VVVLRAIRGLGDLYVDQGKLDEAEQMYRRALAGYEKRLGLMSWSNQMGLAQYVLWKLTYARTR